MTERKARAKAKPIAIAAVVKSLGLCGALEV
jgi:hypothetical protein